MGSLILSRGFEVEQQEQPENDVDPDRMNMSMEGPSAALEEAEDGSTVAPQDGDATENGDSDDDSEEDEDEEPVNVAMVPLADMLNARYGCGNVSHR